MENILPFIRRYWIDFLLGLAVGVVAILVAKGVLPS